MYSDYPHHDNKLKETIYVMKYNLHHQLCTSGFHNVDSQNSKLKRDHLRHSDYLRYEILMYIVQDVDGFHHVDKLNRNSDNLRHVILM